MSSLVNSDTDASTDVKRSHSLASLLDFRLVCARLIEMVTEFPRIIKGMVAFWRPFKRQMAVVLFLNVIIFSFEILLTVINGLMINTYSRAVEWSYSELLVLVFGYLLVVQLIHEALLPYIRGRYVCQHFKFDFIPHVAMMCVTKSCQQGLKKISRDRQPAIIEGTGATYELTQMILREPLVALRGIIILFTLIFIDDHPLLVLVAVVSMVADLYIVIHMDGNLWSYKKRADVSRFAAWGAISDALDDHQASSRLEEEVNSHIRSCEEQWRKFKLHNVAFEIKMLNYQELIRNPLAQLVEFCFTAVLLVQVVEGTMEAGTLLMYIGLLGRARGPFHVIYQFQQKIMDMRPALLRLGEMCQIDFGIKQPERAR